MKKLQRVRVKTSKDFVELVQKEIGKMLWHNYAINSRSAIVTEFQEDPEQVIEVRFIETDEAAVKIGQLLEANYNFSEDE